MGLRTLAVWGAVWGAMAGGSLAIAGCVDRSVAGPERDSEGPGEASSDDDVPEDDLGDEDLGDGEPEPLCPELGIGPELPVSVALDTTGQADDVSLECGGGNGFGDLALGWTAPQTGQFVAYTTNSTFDPVLAVLGGGCDGPALACNDDGNGLEPVVQWNAEVGQTFTFIVDGRGGEGATTLHIDSVDVGQCPDADLGDAVPLAWADENATAPDRGASSCGGFGGPERLYSFTAPIDGLYGFEVAGPFDPVLHLQEGVCSFAELACNDDLPGTLFAGLAQPLAGGQTVTIAVDTVDASGGPFTLVGDRLEPAVCPTVFAESEWPFFVADTTFGNLDSAGSTCGGWATPDRSFLWTPPEDGAWQIAVNADFDWVLSVFDGACDGELLGCRNVFESGGGDGSVVVQLSAGQPIMIVVDGVAGATGFFELNIDRFEGCDAIPLPADPPVSIVGSTAGEPAENAGSCAPTDASPEAVYLFVPPATGQYMLGTSSSSYDTVLYVRAGECSGPELACNDDAPSAITSELVVELVAGQPVYVFVDGYGGDAGPYQLDIIPL